MPSGRGRAADSRLWALKETHADEKDMEIHPVKMLLGSSTTRLSLEFCKPELDFQNPEKVDLGHLLLVFVMTFAESRIIRSCRYPCDSLAVVARKSEIPPVRVTQSFPFK